MGVALHFSAVRYVHNLACATPSIWPPFQRSMTLQEYLERRVFSSGLLVDI